jgi:UDP-GlcNAc:undecaprenyl-phosphate GlcNAc-1-phosphate transferase
VTSGVFAAIALGTTAVLVVPVRTFLAHQKVLDVPSHRSSHTLPTLRGGGIAPAVGCMLAVSLSSLPLPDKISFVLVSACFGALGLSEDLVGVPAFRRLGLQALLTAAFLPLIWWGLRSPALFASLILVATAAWLVAFVNVFNFMDGINGIAVAQALVAGLTWWGLGAARHLESLAVASAALAGASLAFAPANFPRATMFLGDVGSYFIGAWLAVGCVLAIRASLPPEAAVAPLAVFAADAGWTLATRVRRGQRWYEPHRSHAYQRLVQLGWSHARTTGFAVALMAACSALGAVSLAGSIVLRLLADLLAAGALVGYLASPSLVAHRRTRPRVAISPR